MKAPLLLLLLLFLFCFCPLYSQDSLSTDYPFLFKVGLGVTVGLEGGMFFYSYSLASDSGNNGDISSFKIIISKPFNSVTYDTAGLRFSGSDFLEKSFRHFYPKKANEVLPVGYLQLPNNWIAGLANGPVLWLHADTIEVKPGDTLSGFILMSKGLPGLRVFEAMPSFDVYKFFPDLDDTARTMSITQMDSIREAVNFWGWTVGPTSPPTQFNALDWVDTLTSYTAQCGSLAWIKHNATVDKYRSNFGAAKASLRLNNVEFARARLLQVLQDINVDSTFALTTEAYALIRFNTEYLLEHLSVLPPTDKKK
jgi:hypothetical protein